MSDFAAQLNATNSPSAQRALAETAPVADAAVAARAPWYSRPIQLIVICGIVLVAIVVAATSSLLLNLRDRDLAEKERTLQSIALVLAEQFDRSFQSIDLIQSVVIERMQSLGIASSADFEQHMSGYDTYQRLNDLISGLPHIDAIILSDSDGKLINFSRTWPIPSINNLDQDYTKAFRSDPYLNFFISKPRRSPMTGQWILPVTRKFVGPNGEFLGVILGTIELRYFENLFQSVMPGEGSSISLHLNDGTILVRYPRIESVIGQSFPASLNALGKRDRGTIRIQGTMEGKERILAAQRLAHFPLYATVGTDVSAALANWRNGAITLIGGAHAIGLVIAVVIALCVWLVGKKLREQSLQRDTAFNNMSQGLVMFDSAGRLIVANDRYRQIYNLPPSLVRPGCTILELLECRVANGTFPGDPKDYVRDLLALVAQGKRGEIVVETSDGAIISATIQPMARGGWVATHDDITERKRSDDELRRTKNFFNTIIENVPLPIVVKSVPSAVEDVREGKFTLINRAAEDLFGVSRDKIIGKKTHDIHPKDHADFVVKHDGEALQADRPIVMHEHAVKDSNNDIRIVTSRKVAIRGDDGKPEYILSLLDDVTERKRAEQRIAHMAHYDNLTDLPNRAAFNECFAAMLERAAANNEQFSILSVDLDHFKEVNDLFGHLIGDALLREATHRLQAAAAGAFIARIGGDEFMLIVTNDAQPAGASALADRLLAAFADDFEVDGRRQQIGLTIGGAVYPADGSDAKTLMVNADTALYRAKAEMRGSVLFFEPEMSAQLGKRLALQSDLRSAVARGELLLHYQPQVQMSGETIGFEALLRWQCPKRGMVSPGTFIPLAEESGLIVPIGEWVLREACREAASWPQPLTIAVNVSPVQFHHGDLPRLVHSILLATGLAPARLELEVTEGVLINDFPRAVSILRRLKSLGVQIALDDFGTGYSSLSYLHSFAFDRIKIDRAFVGDLEHNRHSMVIVRAVIGLGHSLDVPILAEGVETEIQHAILVQEGCDAMQGYLIGRPQPIADYAALIGDRAAARQNRARAG